MKIGDIFTIEQYDDAYKFVSENESTMIQEIDSKLEDVTKTRQVEKTDSKGNPYFEEETYIVQELVRYYQIVEIPQPTLDELKVLKREEINQARNAAEQGGFEYMGKIFDSDPVSCQRISCAAQAMSMVTMSEEVPTITWTCQDNTTIDLNPQELMGLVVALAQWSNSCHQKATALKEKIEPCTSKEELDKIVWE